MAAQSNDQPSLRAKMAAGTASDQGASPAASPAAVPENGPTCGTEQRRADQSHRNDSSHAEVGRREIVLLHDLDHAPTVVPQ